MMNAFLMYGYFMDPYHIAMYLCSGLAETSDPDFIVVTRTRNTQTEYALDVLLSINILITCLTSFQKDDWVD